MFKLNVRKEGDMGKLSKFVVECKVMVEKFFGFEFVEMI